MTRWMALLLVAACGSGEGKGEKETDEPTVDSDTGHTDTDPVTDTDDTSSEPAGGITASCTQTPENVLRYRCTVEVDPPGPVSIRMEKAAGGGEQEFHSAVVAAEHELLLYLMAPRTDYVWEASLTEQPAVRVEGSFTTGQAPSGAQVTFRRTGTASFPYFMAITPCAGDSYVIIGSTEGELLWYEEFPSGGPRSMIDAASFTEDGTVLTVVSGAVIEKDLFGNELLRLERLQDYTELTHHDVFRKDGHTWVLYKDEIVHEGQTFMLDGIYVFDANGALVNDWRLADHHLPVTTGAPGFSRDYSHANSVWVGEDHDVYVSMRHLSAVARLNADLTSPDFGEIEWVLSGDPTYQPLGNDFALSSLDPGVSPTFMKQHNAHLLPDGTLTIFDNREVFQEPSRLLHLSLDTVSGEAIIEEAYQLPMHCPFQGGAWHTVGGNPVATCSPQCVAFEFDRGVTDTPRWSMDIECHGFRSGYVPRFIPLEATDL